MKQIFIIKKFFIYLSVVLGTLLLINACSYFHSKPNQQKDLFFETWKLRAQESKGHSPQPREKAFKFDEAKKVKMKKKYLPEKPLPKQTVKMLKMYNENVGNVLKRLASIIDQNIIINPNVRGDITLEIQNAPWNETFLGVLRSHGLTYTWEGSIIRIMTIDDMEKEIRLESLKEKKKTISIGMQNVEPLLSEVVEVDYADAQKLSQNLKELLTKDDNGKPRGYVMVDEHTNSLILQANRNDMERMIDLINELDRPTPQILIEADIVEASRDIARNLGIQWGGRYEARLNNSGTNRAILFPGGSGQLVDGAVRSMDPAFGPFGSHSTGLSGNGFGVNLPGRASDQGGSLGFLIGTIGGNALEMQLSMLEAEGKLNIISRPSITTLDNQPAFTESGTKVPYVTTDTEGTSTVNFIDAVLKLEIIPHVINERYLKMKIVVTKDEVDFSKDTLVQGNPLIKKRQTETTLIVENSETIVISGLTKSYKTQIENGIPYLKNIPGLGRLFRSDSSDNNKEDVLIFITPHVLKQKMMGMQDSTPIVNDTGMMDMSQDKSIIIPDK